MLNFDFWDKEWRVITGAPLCWGVVIVIVVIFVIVRWRHSRKVAGLKAEKAALNERFSLAHDEHAIVTQQVETLTKQVAQLSQQIAQKDAIPNLAYTSDTVTGTVHALSFANNALGRTLSITPPRSFRHSDPD